MEKILLKFPEASGLLQISFGLLFSGRLLYETQWQETCERHHRFLVGLVLIRKLAEMWHLANFVLQNARGARG